MTAKAVRQPLGDKTLWQDHLSAFGISWSVLSEVEWLQKPPGTGPFERARKRGWRGQGWPAGGLYIYTADRKDLEADLDDQELVSEWHWDERHAGQRRIVLTLKDLPDLVSSLSDTNTRDPENVRTFLNRWGLLGVGVPENQTGVLKGLAPVVLHGDSANTTQNCLTRLQKIFRMPTVERPRQVHALLQTLPSKSLTSNLTIDLSPSGPERGIFAGLRPLTAFILAALISAPLRQCEECRKFFPVGSQPRRFCSDTCSGRVRQRAFYAKHRSARRRSSKRNKR